MKTTRFFAIAAALGAAIALAPHAQAQQANVQLSLKDHKFSPAEPHAPANTPITITLKNLDATPAEFESKTLRVEKIVPGGGQVSINIRALAPGRYRFFDDYNENATFGFLVVE
ncbi:MAG: cupredoxin domain-containing protein [Hyphomicrobiales bacterium]|nr:cupredoxin domain-containing protein [Hyphomicrobiales bacterium]